MKFQEDFIICDHGGVDGILKNSFLVFYGVEIRQQPKLQVVVVDDNRRPKSLEFVKMPGLYSVGINMCSMSQVYEERFVMVLRKKPFQFHEDFKSLLLKDKSRVNKKRAKKFFKVLEEFQDVLTNELSKEFRV